MTLSADYGALSITYGAYTLTVAVASVRSAVVVYLAVAGIALDFAFVTAGAAVKDCRLKRSRPESLY